MKNKFMGLAFVAAGTRMTIDFWTHNNRAEILEAIEKILLVT